MQKKFVLRKMAMASGIQIGQAEKALDEFLNTLEIELAVHGKAGLNGFGTFERITRKERIGTNPATKEKMIIPEKSKLVFRPSGQLIERIELLKSPGE